MSQVLGDPLLVATIPDDELFAGSLEIHPTPYGCPFLQHLLRCSRSGARLPLPPLTIFVAVTIGTG